MDTKEKENSFRFIILIPHRDAGNCLCEYRQKLFSMGFFGAHSFPAAAPLAAVSLPFSREELKDLALNIRSLTMENKGKILTNGIALVNCANHGGTRSKGHELNYLSFFGPMLKISIDDRVFPESAQKKILRTFLQPVLCAALVEHKNFRKTSRKDASNQRFAAQRDGGALKTQYLPPAPVVSFRAAALANLAIRPLAGSSSSQVPDYSFEWNIGTPVWLPVYRG